MNFVDVQEHKWNGTNVFNVGSIGSCPKNYTSNAASCGVRARQERSDSLLNDRISTRHFRKIKTETCIVDKCDTFHTHMFPIKGIL